MLKELSLSQVSSPVSPSYKSSQLSTFSHWCKCTIADRDLSSKFLSLTFFSFHFYFLLFFAVLSPYCYYCYAWVWLTWTELKLCCAKKWWFLGLKQWASAPWPGKGWEHCFFILSGGTKMVQSSWLSLVSLYYHIKSRTKVVHTHSHQCKSASKY